jgi:hypothetical protein
MKFFYNLFIFITLAGFTLPSAVAQPCEVIPPDGVDINSEAYLAVISSDTFCCNAYWDSICQNAYDNFGSNNGGGNPGGGGNNGGGGTNTGTCITPPDNIDVNSEAYANVIANDFFCCNVFWDGICQNAYDNFGNTGGGNNGGGNWGGPIEGDCVIPPAGIDITSYAYSMVISTDPFCCNSYWDNICTNAYNNFNGNGGGNGGGSEPGECIVPPADIDITSEAYLTVIANDPFCCNIAWDGICQNSYTNFGNNDGWWNGGGNNGGPVIDGDCVIPPDGVDVESDLYGAVIAADPFCCNFNWDMICQNAYDSFGNPGGGNGGGGNTGGGYGPGNCAPVPAGVDTSSAAYNYVITTDTFCCNAYWDGICQNAYDNFVDDEGGIIENETITEATQGLSIDFSYFPNPSTGIVNIFFKEMDGNQALSIKVFNALGQQVYEKGLPKDSSDNTVQIDLNSLPAGMYLISVQSENNIVSKQLIKQ